MTAFKSFLSTNSHNMRQLSLLNRSAMLTKLSESERPNDDGAVITPNIPEKKSLGHTENLTTRVRPTSTPLSFPVSHRATEVT